MRSQKTITLHRICLLWIIYTKQRGFSTNFFSLWVFCCFYHRLQPEKQHRMLLHWLRASHSHKFWVPFVSSIFRYSQKVKCDQRMRTTLRVWIRYTGGRVISASQTFISFQHSSNVSYETLPSQATDKSESNFPCNFTRHMWQLKPKECFLWVPVEHFLLLFGNQCWLFDLFWVETRMFYVLPNFWTFVSWKCIMYWVSTVRMQKLTKCEVISASDRLHLFPKEMYTLWSVQEWCNQFAQRTADFAVKCSVVRLGHTEKARQKWSARTL